MFTIDKDLEQEISSIKSLFLEVISNSDIIKRETTFKEQLHLLNCISKMSNKNILESLIGKKKLLEISKEPKPPRVLKKVLELMKDKFDEHRDVLETGFIALLVLLPVVGIDTVILIRYLKHAYNYKCELDCRKSKVKDKKLSYCRCDYESSKKMVERLKDELKVCKTTIDPSKCRRKIFKLLEMWKQKLVAAEIKLKTQEKISKQKNR